MIVILTGVCALRLISADYEFWSDSLFFGSGLFLYIAYTSEEITHHDLVGPVPVFIIGKMCCYSTGRLYIL